MRQKRDTGTQHTLDNYEFITLTVFKITLKKLLTNYLKYIIIAWNTGKQAGLSGLPTFMKRTVTKWRKNKKQGIEWNA